MHYRAALTTKGMETLGSQRKLLICDDAHEGEDLGLVFDYVANPLNKAKLIVSLRNYGLERLKQQARPLSPLDFLEIELSKLSQAESEALARQALSKVGADEQLAERLAKYTRDCPLATVIGARVIAGTKGSPEFLISENEFRDGLMQRFVSEIVSGISTGLDPTSVRTTLGAIALLQPVNVQDAQLTSALGNLTNLKRGEITRIVKRLRDAGVLFHRGSASRIAPDLLGDFLIEDHCIDLSGCSTGFAEDVFDEVPDSYSEHILLNLGRLDWRMSNGNTRHSRLLEHIWDRLKWLEDYNTPHLRAATAAAYYQPSQALKFVRRMIRQGQSSSELSRVVRNVAYNFDHLTEVCEILWLLGRNDPKPLHQAPFHGVRVLKELASAEPGKPPAYVELVVNFALRLISSEDSWGTAYTPLEILAGALATEGHTTTSTRRTVTRTPFLVAQEPMAALRREIIGRCIALLPHEDDIRAYKAADLLQYALRYPMGIIGAKVSAEQRKEWENEFCITLKSLSELLGRSVVSPAVITRLATSVKGHAHHGTGATRKLAAGVMKKLDATLHQRTVTALIDGWGRLMATRDSSTEHAKLLDKLVVDLIAEYPDPVALRRHIDRCLCEIASAQWVLDGLITLQNLDGFWAQSFLRTALKLHTEKVLNFLKRRVE